MRNIFIVFIFIFTGYSCIDEYELKINSAESRPVFEGVITNQSGPFMMRLTRSWSQLTYDPSSIQNNIIFPGNTNSAVPIIDADIYITDVNESITDTLVKYWSKKRFMADYVKSPYIRPSDSIYFYGRYQTTKLKGIPGHTYALTFKWQNKEYHAQSYMPSVSPIDSVQFNFTQGAVGKSDYNIPLLFFKEPQNERNYYLFITSGGGSVWPYSILSDENLNEYVNGLDVCKGISPDYWRNAYPYVNNGKLSSDYFIEMHSITKEGYEYYKSLIQQFRTDGGGYSPNPASPPTNLDNGALGFFRASAVNRVDFKQKD